MRSLRIRPIHISLVILLVTLAFVAVLHADRAGAQLAPEGYTPPPKFRANLNLQPASTCKDCHLDITEQWSRSPHSQSERSKNLLFGRMYMRSLKVTRGGTVLNCGPCHEPTTFVNQDFNAIREVSLEGVTCVFCHMIEKAEDKGNPPYLLDPANYYGTIRMPVPTTSHQSAHTPYITTSEYCGGCHNYKNQNGLTISETYTEWKASKYAKQGLTCQKCHMPGRPGRNSYLGPVRPRVADHTFDHEALARARPNAAAALALRGSKTRGGDSLRVFVTATNTGWGHSLPTGNDQNIALIRLRVLTDAGAIVWENDPFTEWSVSIFGVILADEIGNWPAETWEADKVLTKRRIKAGASAVVRYDVPLAEHAGPYRIQAQLLLRRARPNTVAFYDLPEDVYGTERVLAEASLKVP